MSNHPITPAIVNFHDQELITKKDGDIIYVALRPIVEGMGLSWSSQRQKLHGNKDKFSCVYINTTGKDGKKYRMLAVPLTHLNGWLFTINPLKVKKTVRNMVIRYQQECFRALYDYWHKGAAINPRAEHLLPAPHLPDPDPEFEARFKKEQEVYPYGQKNLQYSTARHHKIHREIWKLNGQLNAEGLLPDNVPEWFNNLEAYLSSIALAGYEADKMLGEFLKMRKEVKEAKLLKRRFQKLMQDFSASSIRQQ